MEKNKSFDYSGIRDRLMKLKEQAGLDAYKFCEIYAPEKCSSESNAKNYISALSTGRNYPDEKHGPLLPDIEHLLNIVNSDKFPDTTLNYLVYGDETPVKTIEKIDTNPEHWTIADFCLFLGNLADRYPAISFAHSEPQDIPINVNGEELAETQYNFIIKIPEYDSLSESGHDLGMALSEFVKRYEEMKQINSESVQKVMYDKIKEAIQKDKRFSEQSLASCDSDSFTYMSEDGPAIDGLKLD